VIEPFLNPHDIMDPSTDGNGFNFFNFPNYLKKHGILHPFNFIRPTEIAFLYRAESPEIVEGRQRNT